MSKTAVAEEADVSTFDVSKRDEISSLGFRTEHLKDGLTAYEMLGDRVIKGDDYTDLLTRVRAAVQETGIPPENDSELVEDGSGVFDAEIITAEHPGTGDAPPYWTAYRKGDADNDERLQGAGPSEALAIEDLQIAEQDAGTAIGGEIGDRIETDDDLHDAVDDDDLERDNTDPDEIDTAPGSDDRRLPGMGYNKELVDAMGNYQAVKTERLDALKREVIAKDELAVVAHRFETLFVRDPDNDNARIYRAGKLCCRIWEETKEKITTEIDEEDE